MHGDQASEQWREVWREIACPGSNAGKEVLQVVAGLRLPPGVADDIRSFHPLAG
jgi:hypothetical protein